MCIRYLREKGQDTVVLSADAILDHKAVDAMCDILLLRLSL
jgi:hypothetical protein